MKIYLLLILTCVSIEICGQEINSKVDRHDLKKFVMILSSDSLEGRGTGTPGEKKARKLISDRFMELGLSTFDAGGYTEKYTLKQIHWGQVYLKTGRSTLVNFRSMVLQGSNVQNDEIEKDVVFGGTGSESELDQIELEDRLVLVFVKNLRAYYDINRRIEKRKAFGLIVANPQSNNQFESIKNSFKEYALQKRIFLPGTDTLKNKLDAILDTARLVNTIVIPNSQIKNVSGLSQAALRKLMLTRKIKQAPLNSVKIKFERIESEIESANVIGMVKGKSDKTIIVSAHYDHLGKKATSYFPGADDNASGTAALLELAEEFSTRRDLNYNILFIATSGEEAGLLGSFHHANNSTFDAKDVVCNLNIDMISRIDENHQNGKYIYCIGTGQSMQIQRALKMADQMDEDCGFDYSLDTSEYPNGLFSRSDNYNFYRKGIPSIQFFTGLHFDYHKQTDTFEKIDFDNLEKRVRLIGNMIELLAQRYDSGGVTD